MGQAINIAERLGQADTSRVMGVHTFQADFGSVPRYFFDDIKAI